ncbi:MAG: hypothetical protein ACI9ZV_000050 [Candidatus Azotimanducaceae bacterium]|jgi:hypothetical protein
MQPSSFHIRSEKFPVLQEDRDECCNPGTYGKSLVNYLQTKLEALGYVIPFSVAEDFGWWIEIKTDLSVPTNIVLRRSHENPGIADFGITVDNSPRKWSWKRFRFVDLSAFQEKLAADVRQIISSDRDIEFVAESFLNYPDYRINKEGGDSEAEQAV